MSSWRLDSAEEDKHFYEVEPAKYKKINSAEHNILI